MKSGIFIERDGILNQVRVERQHQVPPIALDEFRLNYEVLAPLRKLKAAGFVLIATTNQPGVCRGYLSRRELDRMHEVLRKFLPLDDILVCPHDETDRCPCRKPKPGLMVEAAFKWHIDLERSYVISDKWQCAEAAHTVGVTSLLLNSPWVGTGHHDLVLPDVATIADKILYLRAHPHVLMT